MNVKQIKYIGFDLDNTLIDRDSAFKLSVIELMNELSLFSDALLNSILIKDHSGLTSREHLYEWIIQTLHLKDWNTRDLFDFFAENMGKYIVPQTEVISFLHELSKKYELYLITNGSSKNQRNKIKHSDLHSIFADKIFISEEIGYVKPQKEIYDHVLKTIGISADKTAYVGDNPETDILGANNCGLYSILIRKEYNQNSTIHLPKMIINDLHELSTVFL